MSDEVRLVRIEHSTRRLQAQQMRVWILIAETAQGCTTARLVTELAIELPEIDKSLNALRQQGYVYSIASRGKPGTWYATGKIPRGQEVPKWMPEAADLAKQDDDPPRRKALPGEANPGPAAPRSVFELAGMTVPAVECDIDAIHRSGIALPKPVAQQAARPVPSGAHFSLCSDDSFVIQLPASKEPIVLAPSETRDLFAFLDRLGGMHLVDALGAAA